MPNRPAFPFRRFVGHALAFAALWWVLADGQSASWLVGAPAALAAAAWSARQRSRATLSAAGAARFLAYFVVSSVRGGVDVARRVLLPALPIDPALLDYRLRLPDGAPRVFLAEVVSLLPGTLSAELEGGRLTLHVLDRRLPVAQDLAQLERRVAALFDLELGDD